MNRIFFILSVLHLSALFCYSQNKYDQFSGSLNIGTGYSTLIDFNHNSKGYIVPFQFGVRTQKFITGENYLEFGILFSNKGIDYIMFYYDNDGTRIGEDHYNLSLKCFEISTRYFRKCENMEKIDLNFYYGLNLAVIPVVPEVHPGRTIDVPASYFRKFCPTANSGYSVMVHRNIRLDLGLNIFLLPVIKKEYEDDFSSLVTYYKPKLFPAEILLSINVFIK